MGIEPTWDPYGPHTDFEDQGHHQAPVTSAMAFFSGILTFFSASAMLSDVFYTPVSYTRKPISKETSLAKPKPTTSARSPVQTSPCFPTPPAIGQRRSRAVFITSAKWRPTPKGKRPWTYGLPRRTTCWPAGNHVPRRPEDSHHQGPGKRLPNAQARTS